MQEFFFLCECEAFLMAELKRETTHFPFTPTGSFFIRGFRMRAYRSRERRSLYSPTLADNVSCQSLKSQ
jgi:hypothetical protein